MEQTEKNLKKIDITTMVRDILLSLKRLWIPGVILSVVLAVGMAVMQWRGYVPYYEASISFTVKVVNPLYSSVSGYNSQTAEQMGKTFPYILSSNALREAVQERLGGPAIPNLSASAIGGTNVFTLRARDTDPQRAYDVLQTVVECYPEVAEFVLGPTNMVLLDDSGVPQSPINSFRWTEPAVKGALMGVLLWLAAAFGLSVTRKQVHNEEDLQSLLNCPCLGALPATKVVGKNATTPLAFYDHGKYGFMEATHLLCLHLERELKEKGKKVVLVSSAVPDEGKTTVAANMAISLAQNGNRVLLVDCDLRNPSAAQALRLPGKQGLTELLDGKLTVKELVVNTKFRGVHLVPGGEGKKYTSADLLKSSQFKALIAASRNVFDYILLDTAPCGLVSDASEVADLADCALMVVRQDHASRNQILEAIRSLTESKLPLIGSVLNGARGYSSYGYGYGYGYGYRYSYGKKS